MVSLIAQHRAAVLPLVLGALERNARGHWNATVHGLSCNVRKMFTEMDAPLYEECLRKWEAAQEAETAAAAARAAAWARMEATAAARGPAARVAG